MLDEAANRLGKYDLLGRIGYGGMAEVYLARQHGPMGFEKLVAIKRLLPHLQDQETFVRMFLDEARIAARINHVNVAQIFDLGQADDNYFIAMEYLLGESLARVMGEGVKREQPLPEMLGAAVIAQMCKGLGHAHALCDARGLPLGIVHRDVSPQNVVMLYDGGVKLLDFGIAKARQRLSETTTTGLKGKYAYMSPEQCVGEPVDHRSDIFSCGVVLWELLTHRRLFKHQSKLMMLKMITEGHVAPPSRLNPSLPPELDTITLRALAKRPRDRYQSAEQLSADLEQLFKEHVINTASSELADYLQRVFGEDLKRRTEFANQVSLDDQVRETAEHWLEMLPEPTQEIISFSRSATVITGHGQPPLQAEPQPLLRPASQRWWMATALVALLAALVLGVLLFLSGGQQQQQQQQCRLVIETIPGGARLSLGGIVRAGQTPLTLEALSPGRHRIELQLAGHRPWARQVELRPGETLRLEALLIKASGQTRPTEPEATAGRDAGQPAPLPDAAAQVDRASRRQPTPRAPADPGYGLLNLATAPWATIFHGKRKLGDTPLIGVRLPAGTVVLTAVNPEERIRTTITVQISRGQTLRKRLQLKR